MTAKLRMAKAELIHLVEGDAAHVGPMRRARCGALVDRKHGLGLRITCRHCQRLDREDEISLAALQQDAAANDPRRT